MQQAQVEGPHTWGTALAKPFLSDTLWERIKPLPPPPPKPKRPDRPGRKRIDDRRCLIAILFVLKAGIDREDLPREMGCGCGMTRGRRLASWTEAGVWPKLHARPPAELEGAGTIDWRRAVIDRSQVRARGGGEATGPSPVGRRTKGSKHVVVTDGHGTPLAATVTAANVPDVKGLEHAVDSVPPVRGKPGRPKRRPRELYGDRGSDSDPHRAALRRRGIRPRIARRKAPYGSGLGQIRRVAERTLSWLHNSGRLRVRKDHDVGKHQAFLCLACSLISLSQLSHWQLC